MTTVIHVAPALLLSTIDWSSMFSIKVSLLELFVRGSAMYLGIFFVMRIFRRQKGALNAADVLVLLLVADAAQNAISAEYKSLTEGAVVVGTIFFWDYLLDALSYVSKPFSRFINGKASLLIENGQLNRPLMRREMLTHEEVLQQLREQGVDSVLDVKFCYLETDGHFSVIKYDKTADNNKKAQSAAVS